MIPMLRELRERAGLTQRQVAERTGMSQQNVARLELRRHRGARLETAVCLARALEVPVICVVEALMGERKISAELDQTGVCGIMEM